VGKVELNQPVDHRLDGLLALFQFVIASGQAEGQTAFHPGDEGVDQADVGLAQRVGRFDDAHHLLPECEVLPNDVADALGQGDPADLRLAIEQATVGAIDTAVNQLPECGHGRSSARSTWRSTARSKQKTAEHLLESEPERSCFGNEALSAASGSTLSCSKIPFAPEPFHPLIPSRSRFEVSR